MKAYQNIKNISYQKIVQILGDYIKFPKVITVSSVDIDMFKTENKCKITQVFGAIDGTHIFNKTYLVKVFQHKKKTST